MNSRRTNSLNFIVPAMRLALVVWLVAIFFASTANAQIPPAITVQPTNQTVIAGSNATFSVTATGTAPLDYQWRSNGVDIASATNALLTLTNVPSAASGSQYTLVVTNAFGSVTSSVAALTVVSAPAPGLVAWWTAEGNANDLTGTYQGTWLGTANYAPGVAGQAFSFSGTEYIAIGTPPVALPSGARPRTIEAWVKTSMTGQGQFFSYGTAAPGQGIGFAVYGASLLVNGWSSPQYIVNANVNNGVLHHITSARISSDILHAAAA